MEAKPSSSPPPPPPPPAVAPPPPPPPDPTVTVPLPSITTTTIPTRPHSLYTSTTSPPLLPLPPTYPPHSLLSSILGRPPTLDLPTVGLVRPESLPLSSIRTSPGDQMVTVATHAGYIRNTGGGPIGVVAYPINQMPMPFGFQSSDHVANVQQQQQLPLTSSRTQPSTQFSGSKPVVVGTVANGLRTSSRDSPSVLQTKVNSLPTVPLSSDFCNRYKDLREKYRDGSVVMIHDRRVRLVDTSPSLYALCRSWVQNGLAQESQSKSGDGAKLLPKPLPMSVVNGDSERMDAEEDEDAYEEPKALSARDLFDGHIKRAKRVRTRLKGDRLRRINRYKQRLSLLLPLPVEQDRNSAGGAR